MVGPVAFVLFTSLQASSLDAILERLREAASRPQPDPWTVVEIRAEVRQVRNACAVDPRILDDLDWSLEILSWPVSRENLALVYSTLADWKGFIDALSLCRDPGRWRDASKAIRRQVALELAECPESDVGSREALQGADRLARIKPGPRNGDLSRGEGKPPQDLAGAVEVLILERAWRRVHRRIETLGRNRGTRWLQRRREIAFSILHHDLLEFSERLERCATGIAKGIELLASRFGKLSRVEQVLLYESCDPGGPAEELVLRVGPYCGSMAMFHWNRIRDRGRDASSCVRDLDLDASLPIQREVSELVHELLLALRRPQYATHILASRTLSRLMCEVSIASTQGADAQALFRLCEKQDRFMEALRNDPGIPPELLGRVMASLTHARESILKGASDDLREALDALGRALSALEPPLLP